jgi:hypothetical protein
MAEKDDVSKSKPLSAEESAFRNEAFKAIKSLTQENKRLREVAILGRKSSASHKQSSSPRISGLQGLNTRLGQQLTNRDRDE